MSAQAGIQADLFCGPLAAAVEGAGGVRIVHDVPAVNARRLRERELDAAFLSPLDFARDSAGYLLAGHAGAVSRGGNGLITLHFRDNLHTIRTLAADPSSASEIVLARIVLGEEFETVPAIVPVRGSLEEMLAKADGALLAGDAALRGTHAHRTWVDLVDLWHDMTDLPFVHGCWVTREGGLAPEAAASFDAPARPAGNPGALVLGASGGTREGMDPEDYFPLIAYRLDEEALRGFREFLHYAYYHGVIRDIPEMAFLGEGGGPPPPAAHSSLS
ncbi:MAG: MqnA/MqnD/SBP family protein [Bacteroidota bacterium]